MTAVVPPPKADPPMRGIAVRGVIPCLKSTLNHYGIWPENPLMRFTYGTGSKDATLGLTVATWSDPLNSTNYCASL